MIGVFERNGKDMDEKLTIWEPKASKAKHAAYDGRNQKNDIRKFFRQNPEVVTRLLILALIVSVFVSCAEVKRVTTRELEEYYTEEIAAVRFRTEQEVLARVKEQYGINEENARAEMMEEDAKTLAKVLYPMRDNKVNGLRSAVWCVLNRVDSRNYADDIYAVCSKDQAFMGWSDDNPVLDNLYQIALKEVQVWKSGVRPMDTGFVFLNWTPREIVIFDSFDGHAHKWLESDWEEYDETHGN